VIIWSRSFPSTRLFRFSYIRYIPLSSEPQHYLIGSQQDKDVAAKLHDRNPSDFTDPNHKPKIALALGPFETFCGFKPLADIDNLLNLEPLQRFRPLVKKLKFDDQSVKHVVKAMLEASDEVVKETGEKLRNLPKEDFGKETWILDMLERLWKQHDKTVRIRVSDYQEILMCTTGPGDPSSSSNNELPHAPKGPKHLHPRRRYLRLPFW
jgi:mannose-6-phosphate isomerase